MNKRVLDVACGSKMFWFDKNNPDVEFCDIRQVPYQRILPAPIHRNKARYRVRLYSVTL